jgi:hypothetical protein
MDIKDILNQIDRQRSVIGAQVTRLGNLVPQAPNVGASATTAGGATELLSGLIAADMGNVAAALQSVGEAEVALRKSFRDQAAAAPSDIIDTTAEEVTS